MSAPDLGGWVPIRVYWRGGQPMVDWCFLGQRRFTEPFFEQTISVGMRQPANLLFRHQTPLAALGQLAAARPGAPPSGLIFHMSRCGSTLIAQMLAALPQALVLSEPGPLDTVLRARQYDPHVTDDQRVEWLRWLVSALGQPRGGPARHTFVKFDCWSTLDLPIVERAFPGVPWVFVYRDPAEVLVSHRRQRGPQMVPGMLPPQVLGFEAAELAGLSLDEYAARVLGQICSAALRHGQAGRLLNYRQLPEAALAALPGWFGLDPAPAERERMAAVAGQHAKNPSLPFEPDTSAKQRAADEPLRALAERWVGPAYRALEHRRRAQAR